MQIVIDIPDGCYEELNNGQYPIQDAYRLVAWIKEGTPLPKGHGRLIDKLRAEIEQLQKMCDKNDLNLMAQYSAFGMVLDIIDKYKAESEPQESEE